jgi:hypothetical protein
MLKKFASLGLSLVALAATGCSDDLVGPKPLDLSLPPGSDLSMTGGGGDQGMNLNYYATTPHDIDVASATDANVGKGKAVKISGMVALSLVNEFKNSAKTKCYYEVWVQDPSCSTPPCGIDVQVVTPFPSGAQYCPYAKDSGTILANVSAGDNVDITGTVDNFPDKNSSVVEHEIVADSWTKTAGTAKIMATVVTDPTAFKNGTGSGWAMYESMLVTIQPAVKLQITGIDSSTPYQVHACPSNNLSCTATADFGTTWRNLYNSKDMGEILSVGEQFTSITGIVDTVFGGSVDPRFKTDFVQ